ncbi:MAG: ABC transporter ATP-binding protein [Lachnospiraceae bacterium]|nr:ABC transporter ATP-binding protein [Lachnospiraceae bacterium]
MSELLTVNALSKAFGSKLVLDNINLHLESGRIYGLLGPNGSGKTTLIKLINGLLTASSGEIYVDGDKIGPSSKAIISYLPDKLYFSEWMTVNMLINYYSDFYDDFDKERAYQMLNNLAINPDDKLKILSKGTKEKVQLIMVMSRHAKLYILDEPIGGVDPASRDYILDTILNNYDENASILISTHLITDIERILDEVIFLQNGRTVLSAAVDDIRAREGKSVDELFREVFRCFPHY